MLHSCPKNSFNNKKISNRLPKKERFFRSYNQTKFFENYVIFVIIPTGACQPVALWPLC